MYNNVLPHTRTLCRWYGTIDAEPGFTNEALRIKFNSSDTYLVCNLVFDEMAIHKQRLFHNQQKLGAVNFGAGPQDGDVEDNVASQALVFMLVSLTENWKIPVGVSVVRVTFDGCSANLSAAEILGCDLTDPNNFVTHFPHPCTQEKVCVFLDPCHVIKLIRNSFEKKRLFFDENGEKVR
ncbi:unnamed protein product [Euphydryas editha]|uniref:Transposable element P transposase-like RNase H domain-containing protein n=1 Tax=Euphydryas editha TaxID=104508 RepID=A0AAU9TSK0_EUPED|nr:unnamed protein product [Euphydryas editha]